MDICCDCVRRCGVKRSLSREGEEKKIYGFCGVPRNPVIARAGLHFWEEPCISGKNGSGTVFFSGCNLRCVYCQNYSISTGLEGKETSVARLKEIYQELIAQGAHNINLVTPGHYITAVAESLCDPLCVPVVCNTNGYDSLESLCRLEGKVQIYLPDLKYAENTLALKYSHAANYFETASAAIQEMFRQVGPYEMEEETGLLKKGVLIRHLILPGNVENSLRVIDFIAENFKAGEVLFSLMRQYIPHGDVDAFPELQRVVSDEEYARVESHLFDSGIEDGFVQEEESASSEFIPPFDGSGV